MSTTSTINLNDGSITRSALEDHLQEQGLSGAALEMILQDTAKARHEWRALATIEAAQEWARELNTASYFMTQWTDARAAALLVADLLGPDPYRWIRGSTSIRHPALSGLGKGRRMASDGDAYMAAARVALEQLTDGRLDFQATEKGIRSSVDGEHWAHLPATFGPLWLMSLAREGLRRALGLAPVRLDARISVNYIGSVANWNHVVNDIAAAMTAEDLANCSLIDKPPFEPGPDGNHRIMIQTAHTRDGRPNGTYQVYFLRENGELVHNSRTFLELQEQLGDDRWAQVVQAWEDLVNGRAKKAGGW